MSKCGGRRGRRAHRHAGSGAPACQVFTYINDMGWFIALVVMALIGALARTFERD
ncbi:MAG TPA: hypothetical protein VFK57_23730 [Vicinamibacterales bacterium]|nr:hypothetical protein [Vicinamibacterales bacterium]